MSSSYDNLQRRSAFVSVIFLILSACGHEPVRRVTNSDSDIRTVSAPSKSNLRSVGEQAAVVAVRQIGVPYLYGGTTTRGFDCSGLMQYAYARAGTGIPRTTADQWRQLTPVSSSRVQVGDLLFFKIEGKISHVGLYIGGQRFIHAPSKGKQVSVAQLDSDYYRRAFVRAARP